MHKRPGQKFTCQTYGNIELSNYRQQLSFTAAISGDRQKPII
ncbi:hypothetical protein CSC17_5857 [Klebsiella oxytoca]|nr:hypothetical protein [Klebsiella oxytoca]AWF34790.1 hypothetical protein CSC17_5857 [Klebsiella oxytoca]